MFPQHRTSERESGVRERIMDCRRRLRRVRLARDRQTLNEDKRRAFGLEEILSQTSNCGLSDSLPEELEALELQSR
ncbi:MAG: hypothetical protein AUG51_10805 [Acidobacteria bacterium 13_1_20CM_3_53_8]|nr:MAG: hypothetical protein AUG51_10805 [Acidobacteria bacterium 13_1_20CM_3_53_8]